MLRTANLMSLSTETPVANHTSSEQTAPELSSFAQSLDEGAEAVWKMQSAGDKELKNIVGTDNDLLAKNNSSIVTLVDANGKATLRTDEKTQGDLGDAKGPGLTVDSKSFSSIEEAKTSRREISPFIGSSGATQLEAASKNLSGLQRYPDVMKTFRHENMLDDIGRESLNISSETEGLEAIAQLTHNSSPTASGPVLNGSEKKENDAISNKAQHLILHRKEKTEDKLAVKNQNVKQKSKSTNKFDETAASPTNTVIVPQVMHHAAYYLQLDAHIAANDTQSAGDISDEIGMSAKELVLSSNAGSNKKAPVTKKQDEDDAKASDASNDATNSQVLGAGEAKTTPSTAKSSEADNAKIKIEAIVGAGPVESLTSAAVSGHGSGNATIYANAKSQGAEKSSDTANMHIPINVGDGEVTIDKMHKTLSATPMALEVGVANGTHGWLKVRAEMTGDGLVNTSLSTSSSSTEEMLHRELPSLSAYLRHEHVSVNTVVIQPAILPTVNLRETAGGIGEESRGQAQQEQAQGGENKHESASGTGYDARTGDSSSIERGIGGDELLMPISYTGGGGWLNIRA